MPIAEVIARYNIIAVVIDCTIDKLNKNGSGILIKYGIAFTNGILYKITYINSANVTSKKYNIERKIDCKIWYIKKGVTLFLKIAAIISQIKPANPAVK